MKKFIVSIWVIMWLVIIPTIAYQKEYSQLGPPLLIEGENKSILAPGCVWFAQCNQPNTFCTFYPSAGAGCDSGYGFCFNCYRGFANLIKPEFDETDQFVGRFYSYKYKDVVVERLLITEPGYLTTFGIKKGDSISRVNGKRLRKIDFDNPEPYSKKVITVYTPGNSKSIRTILMK